MQPGKDLSELHDTFWHLNQLQGPTADFSQVVINMRVKTGITFSTPSYLLGTPFNTTCSRAGFLRPMQKEGIRKQHLHSGSAGCQLIRRCSP